MLAPGKSADGKLIRRLVNGDGGLRMPLTGAPATEEIALLRAWIAQGANVNAANRRKSTPRFFGNLRSSEASAVAGNGRGRKVVGEGGTIPL